MVSRLGRVQNPTVVVIGNFDGVHRGHRELLAHAQSQAPGLRLVAVTFWPHPQAVIHPGSEPQLLTGLDDRIRLLKQAGAAEVRVVPFTRDLMAWSPEQFVDQVLAPLHPEVVVVGTNFTFGSRAAGSVETLAELGRRPQSRFRVEPLSLLATDQQITCSSLIRASIEAGDVETAEEHLGRPHRYVGTVVMGHQRGRELGYPTANLPVEAWHLAPADGVYAGWLTRLDEPDPTPMPAAISVGTNPTFDDVPDRVVEAYVLDRSDLELYGVRVAVDFVKRLRGNVKFTGLETLVKQIAADVDQTRQVLGLAALAPASHDAAE
ncbi:Bifunctional riboflavin kinase/FMN adenylyltransferase [Aestuariimicrobium sp. T2.26MG-19.2B]|nr:Bifunctional riboflavin kinase/FMN adenylyltransferase [Aestuariimicrobium sp. T2.26MG-19.2B]